MVSRDLYLDDAAKDLSLSDLKAILSGFGVTELYVKFLSPNDNAKNQPYFGADLSALSHLPTRDVVAEVTTSRNQNAPGKQRLKAPLTFFWVMPNGGASLAPNAQIIFYPQYPEARFSGFGRGAEASPSTLMDPKKRGREPGRVLLLGTTPHGQVYGWVASADSQIAGALGHEGPLMSAGVFQRFAIGAVGKTDKERLLEELSRIHSKGAIPGCRYMQGETGEWMIKPHSAQQAGGYTLEAELGVTPNGIAEPDFLGWEVKQFGVTGFNPIRGAGAMTLMTPEPDLGFYSREGVAKFVRAFGYPDKNGVPNRMNFGGTHYYGKRHATTGLTLMLEGYDSASGKITDLTSGGVYLISDKNVDAAGWSFAKMVNHWKKKHGQAVFVPSVKDKTKSPATYQFGRRIYLAEGTEPLKLLRAFEGGKVYYDPGIKLEKMNEAKPQHKARNQFRVRVRSLPSLYDRVSLVDSQDGSVLDAAVAEIK